MWSEYRRCRGQDLAQGPFERLVIRGATVIDGTGAPPQGPIDVVVERGRITDVRLVGDDFGRIDEEARPEAGHHEIDAAGMYLMPGFINGHIHLRREDRSGRKTRIRQNESVHLRQ